MASTPLKSDRNNLSTQIPKEWPKAFELYSLSRSVVLSNLATVLALFALAIATGLITNLSEHKSLAQITLSTVASILGIWFEAALAFAVLQSAKQQKLKLNDALQRGGELFGRYFLLSLLVGLIAIVSLLLFIVPAFIILPRIILARYYLIDRDMGVIESIKASWEDSRQHVGKVWGIIGMTIAMTLPFFTLVGVPLSIYLLFMYSAAYTILYLWISKSTKS